MNHITELRKLLSLELESAAQALLSSVYACANRAGTILLAGNGGSNANSVHFALDLVRTCYLAKTRVKALALASSGAAASGLTNDLGISNLFIPELWGATENDLFIGITFSGSANVLTAAQEAETRVSEAVVLTASPRRVPSHIRCIEIPAGSAALFEDACSAMFHTVSLQLVDLLA